MIICGFVPKKHKHNTKFQWTLTRHFYLPMNDWKHYWGSLYVCSFLSILSTWSSYYYHILKKEEAASYRTKKAPFSFYNNLFVGYLQMIFDFTEKQLFSSYEPEKAKENIAESFTYFLQVLMSFPINIPGTAYHRCLQVISPNLNPIHFVRSMLLNN